MSYKLPPVSGIQEFAVRFIMITIGTVIGAVGVVVFFVPAQVAPAGVTGLSVITNHLFDTPIGLVTLLFNIPILYLAYRMLGGWQTMLWTVYVVVTYSFMIDLVAPLFPTEGVSENNLLNAIFAGVVNGVGGGIVFRWGGTFGGTATLGRIIQKKLGTPLSSTYLYVNLVIVLLAGVFLGWESALFSLVALVMDGMISDYVLEGPSVIRTVFIITNKPRAVSDAILVQLERGVTGWDVTGMYTGESRHMLYIVVNRPQVNSLRQVVSDVDEDALIVVGQGHVAYGVGFRQKKKKPKKPEQIPAVSAAPDAETASDD